MIMIREKVLKILDKLEDMYPKVAPFLTHHNAYSLLVAVMLSAQCTDERVNMVTPNLFGKGVGGYENGYDSPHTMLELGEEGLKKIIRSCGFYNSKGRNIIKMSVELLERHDGEVPGVLDELVALSGVGVKTASVVLTQWFHIPAMPVDTHVHRISNRLGFCKTKTPEKTEQALREVLPEEKWIKSHLQIIVHGRTLCMARKPQCEECPLNELCEWEGKLIVDESGER